MAGEFSQILAIAIGIRFVVSPTSGLLLALGKVKLVSIWQWDAFFTCNYPRACLQTKLGNRVFFDLFLLYRNSILHFIWEALSITRQLSTIATLLQFLNCLIYFVLAKILKFIFG